MNPTENVTHFRLSNISDSVDPIIHNKTAKPLEFTHLNKVSVFGISYCHESMNFLDQFLFLIIIEVHVPLGKSRFPSTILDKNESNLLQNQHKNAQGVKLFCYIELTNGYIGYSHHMSYTKHLCLQGLQNLDPASCSPQWVQGSR